MLQLDEQQKLALQLLCSAIETLDSVMDTNLAEILEDNGFLPERDLTEMSGDLQICIDRGEIGTRDEILEFF
ncbi:hypothetical protein ASD24_29515 [Paenibacillus sp. Root52]|uniref:hypothetical protein n=1 Tax=Paenibacillus sp. Root52 TaxID=1736552 RepID=UPI00070108C3|nr:hypothetical protein [Paenibacillus sp. Root52]KQY83748.1 hypothetical protein ASD24_29515 [Paenibacillus sp. Root52]